MTENILIALLGNFITLLVATGGWVFAFYMHRDAKERERLARKVRRLEDELRSRIALEKTACALLSEETGKSPEAVKRDIRNKTQEASGLRPKMSASHLR